MKFVLYRHINTAFGDAPKEIKRQKKKKKKKGKKEEENKEEKSTRHDVSRI
jgi:hypothetical protein